MKKNKKIIIPAIALTVLVGASAYGLNKVNAFQERGFDDIPQKIAEKFNLNQDEVNEFFSQKREERREEMQERRKEELNQAVADGKITQDQKNALLEKMEEMRPEMGEMQNLSKEEKQAQREKHREEIHSWAQENGIDLDEIRPEGGRGRGGFGRGFGK